MPQGPIQVQSVGAAFAANHVTVAAAIKATPGVLVRVIVIAPGTAGSLTMNDSATTGGASSANEIFTAAFGSLTVGESIEFNWPCKSGITLSAITTAGAVSISYN